MKINKNLKRIAAKNKYLYSIYRFAYNFYQNIREEEKARNEFNYRFRYSKPLIENYVDTSLKPELNVIIIVIDCLRYRNVSFAGYNRKTTPFLDSFRTKFKAISAAPYTYPSVPSILTGLYPHNHGAYISGKVRNFDVLENIKPLRRNILTLPEILFALGYDIYFATSIDMARYPLRSRIISKIYAPRTSAQKILKDTKKWIFKRKKPFFAYLHLGDIHGPLDPPHNFRDFFGEVKNLPNIEKWSFRKIEEQKGKEFQEYKENRILLYDNTLRYVDYSIEKFYSHLKDQGVMDSTIVVVTADHGEEFWEHAKLETENFYDPRGYYGVGHGHNLFNEIIEVPLLFSGPKIPKKKFDNIVSTVDIMPTLLDLLEIDHKLYLDGNNVFKNKDNRILLSEAVGYGYEKKALVGNRYKLLYSKNDDVQWVFDLKKDPEEQLPIKDKEIISSFLSRLQKIVERDEKMRVKEIIKRKFKYKY